MDPTLSSTEPNPALNQAPIPIDASVSPGLDPVSIDTQTLGNAPMSAELAAARAFKYKFAIPNLPKSYDDLYNSLVNGGDANEREQAAAQQSQQAAADKANSISQIAAGPLTPQKQIQLAGLLNKDTQVDPRSVFEENFAKQFMRGIYTAQAAMPDTFMDQARQEIPNFTDDKVAQGTGLVAKSQFLLSQIQDAQEELKKQSWPGFGLDIAKTFVPGFTSAKMRGNIPGVDFLSGTLGDNLEKQGSTAFHLPFDQFKQAITNTAQNMNPSMRLQWLTAMYGQSTTDATMNSVLEAFDLASLPGTASSIFKVTRVGASIAVADNVLGAVKGMIKATAAPEVTKATVAEAAGDLKTAAVQKAASNMILRQKPSYWVDQTREGLENLPIAMRQDLVDVKSSPGSLVQEGVRRIEDQALQTENGLMALLQNKNNIQMLPEDALKTIQSQILEQDYAGIRNSQVNGELKYNQLTNTYEWRAIVLKPGNELFRSPEVAKNYAIRNGLSDHVVTASRQGIGWYLSIQKPLDQFSDIVRDTTVDADLWKSPVSAVDRFTPLNWIRTAEDTMAQAQKSNRHVATYSPGKLYEVMKPLFDTVRENVGRRTGSTYYLDNKSGQMLPVSNNQIRKDWNRVVMWARDQRDADGKMGMFFKNPEELQAGYLQTVKRLPSENEQVAYFAWKQAVESDRVLRNVAVRRNMERLGTKQYQITSVGPDGRKTTKWFNGVVRDAKVPGGDGNTIAVVDPELGQEFTKRTGEMNPAEYKQLADRIKNGHQVIEIYDTESRPLKDFGSLKNEKIRYVLARNVESKPLDWDQVPRRGGGHFIYDYDHYLKQANIVEETINGKVIHHYEGDNTIASLFNRAEGVKLVKPLNQIRELIKADKIAEAKALSESTMPRDAQEIIDWFKGYPKEDGTFQPPRLNLNEEIRVVPHDRYIADLDSSLRDKYSNSFRDGTKQGSLARQFQVQFTGERDVDHLFTARDVGTRASPVFNLEPATMLDPLPALQRGLSKVINQTWMDDYKFFSVQQWLQEAAPFLKVRNQSEIWHAPFWHFHNPEWLKGADTAGKYARISDQTGEMLPGTFSNLMANRFKINQLIGTPNAFNSFIHAGTQLLADSAYSKFGPTGLKLTPPWLLGWLRDPFSFVRALTFHEKLGLFNIPQFFVQSQTYANIWAIAGAKHAAPGTFGAMLHVWSRLNNSEEILDHLDNLATKFGWKPGQWREAQQSYINSGFHKVGGESIMRDDPLSQHFVTNGVQKFLDWGTTFFTLGDQNSRNGAWYTAYREFRAKNPLGKLDNEARQWILDRADLLNNNMSRASASMLHTGPMSLTSQFLSYQIRTAEVLMSNRLTAIEKGRLVAYNAMLYGVPMSAAMMPLGDDIPGFPVGKIIRQNMMRNGFVVGDNWWKSVLTFGIPAAISAMISGTSKDPNFGQNLIERMRTGSWQNFGGRYGNAGFDLNQNGDQPWYKFILGASSSTIFNFWDAMSPFQRFMAYRMGGGEPFKLKEEHFLKPLEEATAFKSTRRLQIALATGNWVNSNKQIMENDVSPLRASLQSLLGTQDQRVADIHDYRDIKKGEEENFKWAEQKFKEEYRQHLLTAKDNPEVSMDHYNNAESYLASVGYPRDKLPALKAAADREWRPLVEAVPDSFYNKNVPTKNKLLGVTTNSNVEGTMQNAWESYMKIQAERKQLNGPVQP